MEQIGYYTIQVAYNGKEGVEKFNDPNFNPDLIIMDHRMPLLSGIQAMKEILKQKPSENIVFVSADEAVKEEILSLGAKAFILKPFDNAHLLSVIKKILSKPISAK